MDLHVGCRAIKKGLWVHWSKPDNHYFKLNVEGTFKGSKGAYGGLLRDQNGDFVAGFCGPDKSSDPLGTEIDALHEGLIFCRDNGVVDFCVEMDSKIAVTLIMEQQDVQWKYAYQIRKVKGLLDQSQLVKFIFLEENKWRMKSLSLALKARGERSYVILSTSRDIFKN